MKTRDSAVFQGFCAKMTRMARLGQKVGGSLIRFYQRHISRGYNGRNHTSCLYTPSCSEYTRQAIEREGLLRGTLEGSMRLLRCSTENRRLLRERFYQALAAGGQGIRCSDPAAREALERLEQMGRDEASLAQGPERRALRRRREEVMDGLHLVLEEGPPGAPGRPTFILSGPAHKEPVLPLAPRARLAGMAGGMAGALVGAALGGALGLVGGAACGLAAGTGALEAWNARAAARWPDSLPGLRKLQQPLAAPAAGLRRLLGGGRVAALAAGAVGLVSGLAAGMALGVLGGCRVGARAGAALGESLGS